MHQHYDIYDLSYKRTKSLFPEGNGNGAGIKVRDQDSQTPPSQVNVPPVHLYASHNWLAKETQGSSVSPACLLSL